MFINYSAIAAALQQSSFPESVKQFLSEDYLLRVSRQTNSPLRHIREAGQRSAAIWDSGAVKRFLYRRYGRSIPVAVVEFGNALDSICRAQQIATANKRDAERHAATQSK